MHNKEYTILLQKGLAMFDETISLLKLWQPGMTISELTKVTLETGTLGRSTEYRIRDIITRVFYWRYIIEGDYPAKYLKYLVEQNYSHNELTQLFQLYICRTNDALYDFITQVYWPKYFSGFEIMTKNDSLTFLKEAMMKGYMKNPWSDVQLNRIAMNMLGIMQEFRMLGKRLKGERKIIVKNISDNFILYLAHELHYKNFSDTSILKHSDWQLLGLKEIDVLRTLERISYQGFFILQNAGDLLRITWRYKSMEDFIDAISK